MAYSLLGNLGAPVSGLISAPILAHGLGVEGRGELAAANAPLLFATAVGLLGLQESLTFYIARYQHSIRKTLLQTLLMVCALSVVASVVIWFVAEPLSGENDQLKWLIRVAALATVPNFLVAVPRAFVAGTQQWHLQAIEAGISGFLRLAVLLTLFASGNLTTLSALITILGAPIVSGCFYVPFVRKSIQQELKNEYKEGVSYKSLLYFGIRVWLGSMAGVFLTRIDQLLMVPLSNANQLGLYAVAVTVGEIPVLLSFAMRNVVFSADAAESASIEQTGTDRRLQQTARIATLVTFMAAVGVSATAWWWLPLIFGPAFLGSVPLVTVLALAAVLGSTGSVAGAGLSARGRPELRSLGMVIGALLNVVLVIWWVPDIGAMGAAIATVIGSATAGTLNILFLKWFFGHQVWPYYGLRVTDLKVIVDGVRNLIP